MGQNRISGVLWVTIQNDNYKPADGVLSKDVGLNSFFSQQNVQSVSQVFPFAKSESLRNAYEVSCNCDEILLSDALRLYYSAVVTNVEYQYEGQLMYDPADYFWQVTADPNDPWDPQWYLKIMEADKAWDITKGDPNIKVAVMDAGIDTLHYDIAGTVEDTYKDQLESLMAYHGRKWGIAADEIIRHYLTDSAGYHPDSAWVWLGRKGGYAAQLSLAEGEAGNLDYTAAIGRLDALEGSYPKLPLELQEELEARKELYVMLQNFGNADQPYWKLDENSQLTLNGFAQSGSTTAHYRAKNILSFFYGYIFENELAIDANGEPKKKNPNIKQPPVTDNGVILKVYPNPASDFVVFEYRVPELLVKDGMVLSIFTGDGKPVEKILIKSSTGVHSQDVGKLSAGNYLYSLDAGGNKLASGSLMVK